MATDILAQVNSSNAADVDYQPLLRASITVTGALLASLGECSISGMSLGLIISIIESGSKGMQLAHATTSMAIMTEFLHSDQCVI